jgi:hypothetical protein
LVRYCYSVAPKVVSPWVSAMTFQRMDIVYLSRLASNHTRTTAHLQRINIVNDALCRCSPDHGTVDNIVWTCGLHSRERLQLFSNYTARGIQINIPIRDFLSGTRLCVLESYHSVFRFHFLSSLIY